MQKTNFIAHLKKIPGFYLSSGFFLIIFIYRAYIYRWVCDDAFISFRYAYHAAQGHGLVFNPGEKVEGYTNFLWTLLLVLPEKWHLSTLEFSMMAGMVAAIGLLIYYGWLIRLLFSYTNFASPGWLALSLQLHFIYFASSGLETAFFTFLVFSGSGLVYFGQNNRQIHFGFLFLFLSCLTRPEGFLYFFFAIFYRILENYRVGFCHSLWSPLFYVFLLIGYVSGKFIYYGDFLPNTYYAKSGGGSYYRQGLQYFSLFFSSYYGYTLLPILILWIRPKINFRSIFFILPVCIHIVYIIRVGGDFMFARFWIPILPFLHFFVDYLLQFLNRKIFFFFSLFFIFSTILYRNPYRNLAIPIVNGISEEHTIYRLKMVKKYSQQIQSWRPIFEKANIRFAFAGSQAFYAYHLPNNYALEAETGLTDNDLARKTINKRSRVGHEKHADLEFLQKREIDIHFYGNLIMPTATNTIHIDNFSGPARFVLYDSKKVKLLSRLPDFHF